MSAPVALTVFEIPDSECPGAVLSLAVCAFGRSIRVSNTTEQPVTHLASAGTSRCFPRRPIAVRVHRRRLASSFVRPWICSDFDFRAVGAAHLFDEAPIDIELVMCRVAVVKRPAVRSLIPQEEIHDLSFFPHRAVRCPSRLLPLVWPRRLPAVSFDSPVTLPKSTSYRHLCSTNARIRDVPRRH